MSMKIFRLGSFLFAIAFAAAGFCFETRSFAGSAIGQNANSSTTMTENSNAGTTTRRRRGRRQTPPAPPAADTTAVPAAEPSAAVAPVDATVQTDLSGTYAGTFDCADAGLTGDTTLTINGNQFTTSDGKSGRITAATTRGYTGVAMQFGEVTASTGGQPVAAPTIVSLRAKKSRDRLTLTSVPGATHVCSFTPAGSRVAKQRRMPPPAPAAAEPAPVAEPVAAPATPAEPAKPAPVAEPVAAPVTPAVPAKPAPVAEPVAVPVTPATPGAEAGPMPPPAPKPTRRGRRGTAKPKPAPATPPS